MPTGDAKLVMVIVGSNPARPKGRVASTVSLAGGSKTLTCESRALATLPTLSLAGAVRGSHEFPCKTYVQIPVYRSKSIAV